MPAQLRTPSRVALLWSSPTTRNPNPGWIVRSAGKAHASRSSGAGGECQSLPAIGEQTPAPGSIFCRPHSQRYRETSQLLRDEESAAGKPLQENKKQSTACNSPANTRRLSHSVHGRECTVRFLPVRKPGKEQMVCRADSFAVEPFGSLNLVCAAN